MALMLMIGIPVFLVFGGALLAFAFQGDGALGQPTQPSTSLESRPLISFQPTGWNKAMREASVEEIIASIEAQLQRKHEEAAQFVPPLE